MTDSGGSDPGSVVARVPSGIFVMTAAFEGRRCGLCATWVQQCGFEPLLVSVAIQRGHPIAPFIRDSHAFGLCQIAQENVYLLKKFSSAAELNDSVFDALETRTLETGSPLLRRAMAVLDCRVVRHIDFDADHELFIGEVVGAEVQHPDSTPYVRIRDNGWDY